MGEDDTRHLFLYNYFIYFSGGNRKNGISNDTDSEKMVPRESFLFFS